MSGAARPPPTLNATRLTFEPASGPPPAPPPAPFVIRRRIWTSPARPARGPAAVGRSRDTCTRQLLDAAEVELVERGGRPFTLRRPPAMPPPDPRLEPARSSPGSSVRSFSPNERPPLIDGGLAAAPAGRARARRLRLPDPRPALPRSRDNRPPHRPELAGAALVLGAVEPGRRLRAVQLRRRARIAAQNTRETIAKLRALVWEQAAEIDRLTDRLARYERPDGRRKPPAPAIY
jgi:hypothetical protein